MTLDQNYIGIDISQAWLDVFTHHDGGSVRLANQAEPLARWAGGLEERTLVVFEASGHYDAALQAALRTAGVGYVRVNPLRARDFARSLGQLAKTDRLDARMLCRMGRALELVPQTGIADSRRRLNGLGRRRDQLVRMRACEANHAHSADPELRPGIERHLGWLDAEIESLDGQIGQLIADTSELDHDNTLLRSVPGVGPVAATTVLALLPELGQRSDKAIAALAGLAPLNRDSGTLRGTRHIGPGRKRVRQALYMAALNAVRCSPRFKASYTALRQRGKPAKLALIAIARKLIIVLNAIIRDHKPFQA